MQRARTQRAHAVSSMKGSKSAAGREKLRAPARLPAPDGMQNAREKSGLEHAAITSKTPSRQECQHEHDDVIRPCSGYFPLETAGLAMR